MDTRKKLLMCAATCMLAAGSVTAEIYTRGTTDSGTRTYTQQFDRAAVNDGAPRYSHDSVREGRDVRLMHRTVPLNDPAHPVIVVSVPADAVDHPIVALTPDATINRQSLD
jgi:hypothetical protein